MTALAPPSETFNAITGMITFVSFSVFILIVARLRYHVDEEEYRKQKIPLGFRVSIPPEHLLTEKGKRRVRIAKIALGVFLFTATIIVVRVRILSP